MIETVLLIVLVINACIISFMAGMLYAIIKDWSV